MKSNGWHKSIVIAIAALGFAAFTTACTKSSESKESKPETADKAPDKGVDTAAETKPLDSNPVDTNTEPKAVDTKVADDTGAGTTAEVAPDKAGDAKKDPVVAKKDPPKKKPFSYKTVAGDDSYTLKIKYPNEVKNGAKGTVTVTVIPADGWKMNKDFPTKLTVAAPDGVDVSKLKQKVPDAVEFRDGKAVFAVEFTPSSSGSKAFSAKFKFAVCTPSTCDPKKTEMAWNTSVI